MYVFQDLNATIFSQIYQLVKEPPLNYWEGRGCSCLFEQIICFTSYLQNFIFFTLGLKQNIYLLKKKLLSTKCYQKLDLVLMVEEPSEASLHKLKKIEKLCQAKRGSIFSKGLINIYLQNVLQKIIHTLYHENLI